MTLFAEACQNADVTWPIAAIIIAPIVLLGFVVWLGLRR